MSADGEIIIQDDEEVDAIISQRLKGKSKSRQRHGNDGESSGRALRTTNRSAGRSAPTAGDAGGGGGRRRLGDVTSNYQEGMEISDDDL